MPERIDVESNEFREDPRAGLHGMTAVTGLVDAVSFLSLGHVFTANMTETSSFRFRERGESSCPFLVP